MTDEQLISAARVTPEAGAFTARYPDPAISVDRSGDVAVDFRVPGSAIRLRVFMAAGPRASRSFLECPREGLIQENVADAARRGCPTE